MNNDLSEVSQNKKAARNNLSTSEFPIKILQKCIIFLVFITWFNLASFRAFPIAFTSYSVIYASHSLLTAERPNIVINFPQFTCVSSCQHTEAATSSGQIDRYLDCSCHDEALAIGKGSLGGRWKGATTGPLTADYVDPLSFSSSAPSMWLLLRIRRSPQRRKTTTS